MEVLLDRPAPAPDRLARSEAGPAPLLPPRITFPIAAHVLAECPGELGDHLWRLLRTVDLFAARLPDGEEADLAGDASHPRPEVPAAIREPAAVLGRLAAAPGTVDAATAAAACGAVADWADTAGLRGTAYAFAAAAARALPASPAEAYHAGIIQKRRGETASALDWYQHTRELAEYARDHLHHALALLGIGNVHFARGAFPAARASLRAALRLARHHRLRDVAARTLHDLFALEVESGKLEAAERLANAASRAYGPQHPRLPALGYDMAYLWMLRGQHRRALPVLRSLLAHFDRPEERIVVAGALARAAGGSGAAGEFQAAWREVWRLSSDPAARAGVAAAFLQLGHGARSLGDFGRAQEAGRAALAWASRDGETQNVFGAEAFLDSLRQEGRAAAPAAPAPRDDPADRMARRLVHLLEARASAA